MESMDEVDLLVVICEGHLAFAGPPAAALEFFRVPALRALFDSLKKQPGRAWQRLFERVRPQLAMAAPPTASAPPAAAPAAAAATPAKAAPAPVPDSSVDAALAALKQKLGGEDG
jgi:hypothetical protein